MTRYPKGGKNSKWSVKELQGVTPAWKGDVLSDSGGLSGDVRVSSSKNEISIVFRYAFKWQGKLAWHYCGTFPKTDISAIREIRDNARKSVAEGVDPRAKKISDRIDAQEAIDATIAKAEQKRKENLTFNDLYTDWLTDGVSRADDNKTIKLMFNKHILPVLRNIPIRVLKDKDLLKVYRGVINQGKQRTAVVISNDIGQMLRWAEKRQPWRVLMTAGNPADLVEIEKLLSKDYCEERNRTLSVNEISTLGNIFTCITEAYKQADKKYEAERPLKNETQIALWLCLSTVCRIGELLMTEWTHVDFEARTWLIPKENVKGTRRTKQEQLVFLSDFALEKFKQLHKLTGKCKWAFPAANKKTHVDLKSVSKQVGDRQTQFKQRTKLLGNRVNNNSMVLGNEEWTPHDLRRTGATMMQELGVPLDVIDRCQNHVLAGSQVRRHYLHYEYADEKRAAWCKLGDRLNVILNSANVVNLKAA